MSSKPIIEIKGIGKKYNITHQRGGYIALRDVLANILKNPFKFAKAKAKQVAGLETKEEFWALKDVSFEVQKGEVIGIIGRNGAGKSTLLKILTGITPPTEGEIIMRGRVASLLEVGTGFHPELTGRENIFLNGAILGMTKKEIVKKFDEIVAFAGIEKFLDTPVKYYSSGMYVRLAFSVAAHMEPDILLVDEVLAVGDAEFQKKCLGKMEEVTKKDGRTILFVSHNMVAMQSLCSKAVLLEGGKVKSMGPTDEIIKEYLNGQKISGRTEWEGKTGDKDAELLHTWVRSLGAKNEFLTSVDIEVGIEINILKPLNELILGFTLLSEFGYELAYILYDDEKSLPLETSPEGKLSKKFIIPKNTLAQGKYRIQFDLGIHGTKRIIDPTDGEIEFTLSNVGGQGKRFQVPNAKGFASLFRPKWEIR